MGDCLLFGAAAGGERHRLKNKNNSAGLAPEGGAGFRNPAGVTGRTAGTQLGVSMFFLLIYPQKP